MAEDLQYWRERARVAERKLTDYGNGVDAEAIKRAANGLKMVWGEDNVPCKAINWQLAADIAIRATQGK